MGFLIEPFGNNTFVIQGTPADLDTGNEKQIVDFTIEQYKHFNTEIKISNRKNSFAPGQAKSHKNGYPAYRKRNEAVVDGSV
ncbi:hypothetical protein LWM68_45150 [Niabella sp. W65]|nr:hypothetical protein [Niabella sp. W65]MCH7369292.1 hypothetical protein [Niabella sp. W65]